MVLKNVYKDRKIGYDLNKSLILNFLNGMPQQVVSF